MQNPPTVLLPTLFKHINRIINGRIDAMLKSHGIARSQYRVLYYAARIGEPTQKDLVEAMNVQGSTITLLVTTLVKKGWLVRAADQHDRRITRVQLTKAGKKLLHDIPDPVQDLHQTIAHKLTKTEIMALETLLQKVADGLEDGQDSTSNNA